ncbi:unnamed protein product [Caenorhabditis auriculariae]|uniref:PDZ domain-containing protein n=1 Tax=Caenorhabditis auriculariae TaxID=2777116 RepID=A0A8S1H391_9PELO|nr:unnamed protein product [Caenorhabditis auriculariae]
MSLRLKTMTGEPDLVEHQVIKQRILDAFEEKLIPMEHLDIISVQASLKRLEGLSLGTKRFVVSSTHYDSPFQGKLKTGDILLTLNNTTLNDMINHPRDILSKLYEKHMDKYPITFSICRPKRKCKKPPLFPKGFQKTEGFDYESKILFKLRGIKMGLDAKEIDKKVYVYHTVENTLASMTFSVGECIVAVEGEGVASCGQLGKLLKRATDSKGFVICTVETPVEDRMKNYIRVKLGAAKDPASKFVPVRIPEDVQALAKQAVEILKNVKEEPTSIMTVKKTKSKRDKSLVMSEKVVETDILSEWNSCLFVKLPPAKTLESEAAARAALSAMKNQ